MNRLYTKLGWLFIIGMLVLHTAQSTAQKRTKLPKGNTEQQLVFRIVSCLANEDAQCYTSLFPDMDTLSKLVMQYSDSNSKDFQDMAAIQADASRIFRADSSFRGQLKSSFNALIKQGKEQHVHWQSIVPVRYELVKARQTRDELYEKLAPTRFTGYFFVMDGITRKTYGFIVSDMLQIKEEWYGGYLGEIYEATTRDEYADQRLENRIAKRSANEHKAAADTSDLEDPEEPDNRIQKMIVGRSFYTGMFDNEIPVQLYIRSLKGTCPEGICAWEAIYKFGDQDDYILLTVSKTGENKWLFTEEPPTGSMELILNKTKYTGSWISADNQTGYEVKLSEAPASAKKIERLDAAFLGLTGGNKK